MHLPDRVDVVIVGGGVMGASAAFHLAEVGVSVLLCEKNELASGSTSKAAGGVRANFSDEFNVALGARSLDLFSNFINRPGYEIDLHRPGYLFALTKPEDVALFERSTEIHHQFGVESRMISPSEAKKISPLLHTDDLLAASFTPNDGHCTPEAVVLGYAGAAKKLGATVLTGVEVTGINHRDGEITSVTTSAGNVATNTVINCAGAWSPQIASHVGLDLPVTPFKRELVITDALDESFSDLPASMPMTIDYATSLYWHREGPGVLYGMSYQAETPGFKLTYSDEWLGDLGAAMERRCPELLEVGIAHQWAGLYEITPDHNALIGEASTVSRFIYAAGFSGHGFLQGPAIGEVLRDLYLRREPLIDVRPFTAERFATGSLRGEVNIV